MMSRGLLSLWEDWHWDDSKGGWLHPDLCGKARCEEVVYIRRHNMYESVPRELARSRETTHQDRMGDPNVRAKWVANEYETHARPEPYASTPPLEALKSHAVRDCHRRAQRKGRGTRRRAKGVFYAPSRRRAFVELPPEDYQRE